MLVCHHCKKICKFALTRKNLVLKKSCAILKMIGRNVWIKLKKCLSFIKWQ